MANTIKFKRGSGSDPDASDLSVGELAIRTDTALLFTKNDGGSVVPIGISDGDKGDITVSSNGGTFTIDSGVVTSAKIANDTIVNADINSSAAIDGSKISPAFTSDITGTGNLTLTSTNTGSSAAPELELYRNSSSPADADYLGQLKFTGESDDGSKEVYAKVTGKIDDASSGTEDGIIEFALRKAGSNVITGRFKSTVFQLLNGTGLSVNGNISTDGTVDGRDVAADGTKLDGIESGAIANLVSDTTPQLGGDLDMNSKSISSGILGIKNTGSQSELRLYCEVSNAHYVAIKAPPHAQFSGNPVFQLPPNGGTNGYFLTTNGSGVTSWSAMTIANDSIDSQHYVDGSIDTAHVGDSQITNAKIDSMSASKLTGALPAIDGSSLTGIASGTDINNLVNNIAVLGFKLAVQNSLTKFNLVNQVVDEFIDKTGVDLSASTNEILVDGAWYGVSGTAPTGGTITEVTISGVVYKLHTFTSSGNFVASYAGTADMLIVGGGGGGGNNLGGGGAGGEVLHVQNRTVAAGTYAVTRGNGGSGGSSQGDDGSQGTGSSFGSDFATTNLYARPGGGGGGAGYYGGDNSDAPGVASTAITGTGNGGGGGSYAYQYGSNTSGYDPTNRTVIAPSGETWVLYGSREGQTGIQENANYDYGRAHNAGGGAGAAIGADNDSQFLMVMQTYSTAPGGNGGHGVQIDIDGNNYYWGGGGGGTGGGSQFSSSYGGDGGAGGFGGGGGGGAGTSSRSNGIVRGSALNSGEQDSTNGVGGDGGANTGGGGGGGRYGNYNGGDGGSGIVMIRYRNNQFVNTDNLTLQSTDTTAVDGVPTSADLVVLMEDKIGTATLNTDIKGFISRDSGSTFTQGTLVDEGTYGASTKRIIAFHDLDISGSGSGTSVCYKITTHNQGSSKQTRIEAVSHGWK